MVGSWGLETQTSTVSCQRPANQYAEQLRERRGPPKHAEIRVRRSFNGTESGTEFPGRCSVLPVTHSSRYLILYFSLNTRMVREFHRGTPSAPTLLVDTLRVLRKY